MGLETESPLRVLQAVFSRQSHVFFSVLAIHWLQIEVSKLQAFVRTRVTPELWKYKLQFVARLHDAFSLHLGTHRQPVNARGRFQSPVGLNGHFEPQQMKFINELLIHLQQWFTTGANDKSLM